MKQAIQQSLDIIKERGIEILLAQEHNATGTAINSFTSLIEQSGNNYIGSVYGEHYLLAQETGVKAEKIRSKPYSVREIIEWIRVKGIVINLNRSKGKTFTSQEEAERSVAYAIRRTHMIVGMHSRNNSLDVSKQGWLTTAINETKPRIDILIEEAGAAEIDLIIRTMIEEENRNIKK